MTTVTHARLRSQNRAWPCAAATPLAGRRAYDAWVRLLAFSDLHCDLGQAEVLVERSADADVVAGVGDFASVHRGLERTIKALAAIDKPVVLVPGNNETEAELREAAAGWESATVLHGEATEIGGVEFFGLGGGIPDALGLELRPRRGGGERGARGLPAGRRPPGPLPSPRPRRQLRRGPPPRQQRHPQGDRALPAATCAVWPHPRQLGRGVDGGPDPGDQPRPRRSPDRRPGSGVAAGRVATRLEARRGRPRASARAGIPARGAPSRCRSCTPARRPSRRSG